MPDSSPTKLESTNNGLSLSEAVRRKEFWGFFTIFGATAIAVFGVSLQTVAYLIDHKFDPISAAFAYGLTGMLTILGIAITGILAERFPRHIIATGSYTLTAVGILGVSMSTTGSELDSARCLYYMFWVICWCPWSHHHSTNGRAIRWTRSCLNFWGHWCWKWMRCSDWSFFSWV
jgi:hypothetical protein